VPGYATGDVWRKYGISGAASYKWKAKDRGLDVLRRIGWRF